MHLHAQGNVYRKRLVARHCQALYNIGKKKRKHMPYDLYVNKKKQQILQELPNITMQSIRQLST